MHKNMRKKLTKNAKNPQKIDELYTFFFAKKNQKTDKKNRKNAKKKTRFGRRFQKIF
jgi:hypothetical protein